MGQQCSDNWYSEEFYDGEIFAVLQPKRMVCHKTAADGTVESEENIVSPKLREFSVVMMMQLYAGSMIIMFILYRSCSSKRTDPFRLVFMYLLGTVGFALSLNFGPSTGGFTRLLGWGVMVHNIAEWFIISRIWWGEQNALLATFYMIGFVILITLMPLVPLFYLGMFQGGYVDYLLVYTAIYMIQWTGKMEKLGNIKSRRKYMCAGAWGAIVHIVSIQPLFFGMATAYSPLAYLTTLFILPTFVLYSYWASSGRQKINLVKPNTEEVISSDEDDPELIKRYSVPNDEEMQRIRVADSETDQDDEKNGLMNDGNGRNDGDSGKPKLYKDVALDVIARGVSNIDPSTKKARNFIFVAAFLTAVVNSFPVFFAPCYLDFSSYIQCE